MKTRNLHAVGSICGALALALVAITSEAGLLAVGDNGSATITTNGDFTFATSATNITGQWTRVEGATSVAQALTDDSWSSFAANVSNGTNGLANSVTLGFGSSIQLDVGIDLYVFEVNGPNGPVENNFQVDGSSATSSQVFTSSMSNGYWLTAYGFDFGDSGTLSSSVVLSTIDPASWSSSNPDSPDFARIAARVPLPPTAFLFGSALLGLVSFRRWRRA